MIPTENQAMNVDDDDVLTDGEFDSNEPIFPFTSGETIRPKPHKSVLIPSCHDSTPLCMLEPKDVRKTTELYLQVEQFATDPSSSDGSIVINKDLKPLMNHATVCWLETLYAFQNVNEKESPPEIDEYGIIDEIFKNKEECFLQSLIENTNEPNNCGVVSALKEYLFEKHLSKFRIESLPSNQLLKTRAHFVRYNCRIFEFGTLMYYLTIKRDTVTAFDYALWFFRNSNLRHSQPFCLIMVVLLTGVFTDQLRQVIKMATVVAPNLLEDAEKEEDPILLEYLRIKINQIKSCISRFQQASEAQNGKVIIEAKFFEKFHTLLNEDFSYIYNVKQSIDANPSIFAKDEDEDFIRLRNDILEKWDSSWEIGLNADKLPFNGPNVNNLNCHSKPLSNSSNMIRNMKMGEFLSMFPQCRNTINTLRNESEDDNMGVRVDDGWLKSTGIDPVGTINAMQRSLEGVHSCITASRIDVHEKVDKKIDEFFEKAAARRLAMERMQARQNAQNIANTQNPSTTASPNQNLGKRKESPGNGQEPNAKSVKQ